MYKPISRFYYTNIYNENEIKAVRIIEKHVNNYLEKKKLDRMKKAVFIIQYHYFNYLNHRKTILNNSIIPYIKRKQDMDEYNRLKVATLILQKHYNNYYIHKKINQYINEKTNEENKKWRFLWF